MSVQVTGQRQEASSLLDLIGNTPLLRLRSIEARAGTGAEVWAKCELANPGGSVKDRAARQMILDALADGSLTPGKRLIDSTSGNTGVAYSMIGAALGIPITLVMPANVSIARKQSIGAYGTNIIYSSELEGSDGAIHLCRELVDKDPDKYFYPDQYSNDSNPRAHYLGTGTEILRELGDRITHFVAGIGTTGTIMGTGRRLKELNPKVAIIAVEPLEPMHGLEGLKHLPSSIIPPIYEPKVHDEKLPIPTDEGWAVTDRLLTEEGLAVGHSSGANMAGALRLARRCVEKKESAVIVTLFADRADRYFEPRRWERDFTWP